jgi:hypothetical protein
MAITSGPVLELGAGLGSTYLLHGLCGVASRKLLTLDSNQDWLLRFINYGRPWHKFNMVESYLDLPEYKENWGLAFVDHGIYEQRGYSITQLKHVPVIVVHDTCHPWLYGYNDALDEYCYRWDYWVNGPQTTVISNIRDIRQEFARLSL